MAVQYSIQKMVSDGTLSTIALGIQYLQRNDIYIRIAGEETPQSGAPSGYTWSFLDNTTLKILPGVPNGVEVVVYRRTDVDAMYNIYSQNAQFDEATIDENNQQLLYIAQEYLEQGLPGTGVDTIEYVRDDGSFTYYRMRRTDGSYSEEFTVPSASNSTKVLTRESLCRSYAEAGYNLVDGSFEAGGTLVNANDVLLQERTGKAFSGPAGAVAPGTNPASGGFVGRSSELLRDQLSAESRVLGAIADRAELVGRVAVGTLVTWMGYNVISDGGSNWGVVYDSAHTEDGLEYFTISGTLHIKANLQGTISPMKAGLFGGATDAAKMQNLLDKSSGKVKLGRGVTYDLTSGLNVNTSNSEADLNGASLNFTVGLGGYGLYDKGDRNRIHKGSISVNYTAGSGGNGHAGACITLGNQSTGAGIYGFKYDNLTLTTNRSDAGAHISGLGENRNGKVTKITILDNAVCRNLIGFEWGGNEIGGTGHPHNIDISKIYVGKITTPTYGGSGYAYVVWVSGGFNISVKTVFAEEAYGLMMCIAGDKSNDFAPAKYKGAVGSGLSLSNATLMACFGFGIRCVGKGTGETTRTDQRLKASGIYITGKKVGANNNFALQTEFSNGVHLSDFKFDGVWAAGTTTGAEVKNLTVENGEITGCQLYGSSVGSGAVNGKSKSPTIRRVHYYNNNTLAGVGSGTSAVVINDSDDALVEHCRFGKEGVTETQRYSVYAAASANRPRVVHNQTFVNDNPAINPYLLASATVYQVDNTKSW